MIYFRNSFCFRIENSRSFRYKILGHVGPLGKTLIFLFALGSLKFYDFLQLSFLFILKLLNSKFFQNNLNYASTTNIEEALKCYNLGDKTFETDFDNVIGEKKIDLSCLIKNFSSSKEVAVDSLFSDNIQCKFTEPWTIELKSRNRKELYM